MNLGFLEFLGAPLMSTEKTLPDEYKPAHDIAEELHLEADKLEDEGAEAGNVRKLADRLSVWVDSKTQTVEYGAGEPPPEN